MEWRMILTKWHGSSVQRSLADCNEWAVVVIFEMRTDAVAHRCVLPFNRHPIPSNCRC